MNGGCGAFNRRAACAREDWNAYIRNVKVWRSEDAIKEKLPFKETFNFSEF